MTFSTHERKLPSKNPFFGGILHKNCRICTCFTGQIQFCCRRN